MSRSAGWTFAVLSSSRGVNNLAIAPWVTDAGHASRASRVKRAVGLERAPNQYGVQTPSRAFWEPPCRDAACALHILILSFGLYGDLPSHNNAYAFSGHTRSCFAESARFGAKRRTGCNASGFLSASCQLASPSRQPILSPAFLRAAASQRLAPALASMRRSIA
jgi:hypothetical protein